MTSQLEFNGAYGSGYMKTLLITDELKKDLETIEFLSTILTNPLLNFHAKSTNTAETVNRNYKILPSMVKNNKNK